MKLLACHDQFVATLDADQQQNHLCTILINIVQHSHSTHSEFVFSAWVRPKPADGLGLDGWLINELGDDRRLHGSLVTSGQSPQMAGCDVRDRDLIRHPKHSLP